MLFRLAVLSALLLALPSLSQAQAPQNTPKEKVLLVYSSGEPFQTITDIKDPDALEAITSPTPLDRNTRIAAQRIYDNLTAAGITVRLARVEDFGKDDWREVLSYDTIIVGTPARFWTMSWETKRFVDLIIGRIYVLPEKAKGKQFALFATAEIENSSNTALENMAMWVNDLQGNLVLKLNLNREQSQPEFDQAIDRFTTALAVLIK
ncbi:MAG: hypothetical protein V1794_10735 [Candidatus Glassbacteria bacterium]